MWRVIVNLTPTDAGSRTSDRGPAPSAPRRANLGWGPAAVAVVGLGVFGLGVFAQRHDRPVTSLWFFLLAAQLVLGDLGSAALRGATLSAEGVAFFAISLGAVVASVWLQRRSLLVVGALGCYSFVGYLAFRVFGGTLGFTYGLAVVGLVVVLSAVAYERWAGAWLRSRIGRLPSSPRGVATREGRAARRPMSASRTLRSSSCVRESPRRCPRLSRLPRSGILAGGIEAVTARRLGSVHARQFGREEAASWLVTVIAVVVLFGGLAAAAVACSQGRDAAAVA